MVEGIDKDSACTRTVRDRWLKVEALSEMAENGYILQLKAGRLKQNENLIL